LYERALAVNSKIGKLVARAARAEEIMVITTRDQGMHAKYWAEGEDRKQVTYRRDLRTGDQIIYAGALTTTEGPNTPGLFWLEEAPPPPDPFGYDDNYKKEWGWTQKRHEKGHAGYKIKDRIRFKNWILLAYGCSKQRVQAAYLPRVYDALAERIKHG
jgi:hypothetical protein